MVTDRNPYSTLIVTPTEKTAAFITEMLGHSPCEPIKTAHSSSEARQALMNDCFDIVMVNAPLSDEFGHELAMDIAENGDTGVMLLVKSEIYDEICSRVNGTGVMVVPKPVNKMIFYQVLNLICAAVAKLRRREAEKRKLEAKIEELRVVSRAKCALIENMKLTEAEAHKYIEKQAMNSRKTRRELAEDILRLYGI